MLAVLFSLVCVASAHARHTFIVGGSEAEVGAWKYQISLRIFGRHTCGGSLVADRWVLCAAHCVGSSPSSYSVIVGMHDQAQTEGQPVEYKVESHKIHPDYGDSGNYPNDVSLVYLKTAVNLTNPFVELATMAPDDGHKYDGELCYISGWGLMKDGGDVAPSLQEAQVDCLSNTECQYYWGEHMIDPGQVCIFDKANEEVCACNGDSGGPLSCWRNNAWYVVGIASWVADGCLPSSPGVYTRVSEYRTWIDKIMEA